MSLSWKKLNPELTRKQNERYAKRIKERCAADPKFAEQLKTKRTQWRKANPNRCAAVLRERVLTKLGRKCNNPACQWLNADGSRGCIDVRCLQVDHVNGGGKQELKKLSRVKYLAKVLADAEGLYQLLCANCNWIKRHDNREV